MNFGHFVDFSGKTIHNIQKMNNFLRRGLSWGKSMTINFQNETLC